MRTKEITKKKFLEMSRKGFEKFESDLAAILRGSSEMPNGHLIREAVRKYDGSDLEFSLGIVGAGVLKRVSGDFLYGTGDKTCLYTSDFKVHNPKIKHVMDPSPQELETYSWKKDYYCYGDKDTVLAIVSAESLTGRKKESS